VKQQRDKFKILSY